MSFFSLRLASQTKAPWLQQIFPLPPPPGELPLLRPCPFFSKASSCSRARSGFSARAVSGSIFRGTRSLLPPFPPRLFFSALPTAAFPSLTSDMIDEGDGPLSFFVRSFSFSFSPARFYGVDDGLSSVTHSYGFFQMRGRRLAMEKLPFFSEIQFLCRDFETDFPLRNRKAELFYAGLFGAGGLFRAAAFRI